MMRMFRTVGSFAFASLVLLGCASIQNDPVNLPGTPNTLANRLGLGFKESEVENDVVIGLSFSGGGTRAAAFSFGVLSELEQIPVRGAQGPMIEHVDFISGVSGGSVTAAYYGLKKRAGLTDFREKFLLRNAEEGLQTDLNLTNLSRALAGGINDATGFPRWLDANLFHGATFGQFRAEGRPRVWINASDIYNRTPFVFEATAFRAICSDLSEYPLADAVAASAAVPVAFAPIVIRSYPGQCNDPLPSWIARVRDNPSSPPLLTGFARAMTRYRDGSIPASSCSTVALSITSACPALRSQGYRPTRLMVRSAQGRRSSCDVRCSWWWMPRPAFRATWINTVQGPNGVELVKAAADTAIDASVAGSFTAFDRTMSDWQGALVGGVAASRLPSAPSTVCPRVGTVGISSSTSVVLVSINSIQTGRLYSKRCQRASSFRPSKWMQ